MRRQFYPYKGARQGVRNSLKEQTALLLFRHSTPSLTASDRAGGRTLSRPKRPSPCDGSGSSSKQAMGLGRSPRWDCPHDLLGRCDAGRRGTDIRGFLSPNGSTFVAVPSPRKAVISLGRIGNGRLHALRLSSLQFWVNLAFRSSHFGNTPA